MKKSLIALATLSACAAQAATASKLKPSENDDALALAPKIGDESAIKPGMPNDERYIKPIVTREMLAGTQPMLDKRPIHIDQVDDKRPKAAPTQFGSKHHVAGAQAAAFA